MFHDRSKHIEIRDMIHKGAIKLQYVSNNEKVANGLMKPLSQLKFKHFRYNLGVVRKDIP